MYMYILCFQKSDPILINCFETYLNLNKVKDIEEQKKVEGKKNAKEAERKV